MFFTNFYILLNLGEITYTRLAQVCEIFVIVQYQWTISAIVLSPTISLHHIFDKGPR
jgi:hypothetical protein